MDHFLSSNTSDIKGLSVHPGKLEIDRAIAILSAIILDGIDGVEAPPHLFDAIETKHELFLRALIKLGADVNVRDQFGKSPLWHACRNNDIDFARILLAAGADPNLKNSGSQPLHAACQFPPELYGLLVENGADVNARDSQHQSVLDLAKRNGNDELVTYINCERSELLDSRTR